jgi:hypothetical protein
MSDTARPTVFQHWSHSVMEMVTWQWRMFETNCQAGLTLMEMVLTFPADPKTDFGREGKTMSEIVQSPYPEKISTEKPGGPARMRILERVAAELANQGLIPPKEIYEAPYRNRIDWSIFPAWARPSDPELFQDCGHEG